MKKPATAQYTTGHLPKEKPTRETTTPKTSLTVHSRCKIRDALVIPIAHCSFLGSNPAVSIREVIMRTRIVRGIFKIFFAVMTRLEVSGLEYVPAAEAYILATNHMSYFDPPLLYSLIGDHKIAGFVADKYRKNFILGTIVRLANPIFVRRGSVDRQALDAAVQILQSGTPFGMAPEGTRSKNGALNRGKSGIALLADLSQTPIILAAITGTDKGVNELLRLRRPQLTVQFAPPFSLPPLDVHDRSKSLRRNADEVMCRLAAMLPESYRGVYAEHPRLREFLPEYSTLQE